MHFAVFRFTRNGIQEQWIAPLEHVIRYSDYTDGQKFTKLVIPVSVSKRYSKTFNVVFLRKPTRIWSLQHSAASSYFLFESPKQISDHVLNHLVEQWDKEKTCRLIQPDQPEINNYRL